MSWTFNPPPGWPAQPAGWVPPPGWTPDPGWPPPPAGWQFWVPADPAPASPPAPATPPAPPPPFPAARSPYPVPPPYPAAPASVPRAWFARWWGILGLVGALLVGGLVGFGGTNLALASGDDEPAASPTAPEPQLGQTPEATGPGLALPSLPPLPTFGPGGATEVCGEVAVVMIQMLGEQLQAYEADDPQAAFVESRRTAATALRDLDAGNDTEQQALETFADELDAAADDLEGGAFTEDRVDDFLGRTTSAWDDFDEAAGC